MMSKTKKTQAKPEKPDTKMVLFTQSPTGTFKLAYSENEVGEVESKLADELIDGGYASEVENN